MLQIVHHVALLLMTITDMCFVTIAKKKAYWFVLCQLPSKKQLCVCACCQLKLKQ